MKLTRLLAAALIAAALSTSLVAQIVPGRYIVQLAEPVAAKASLAEARAAQVPMRNRLAVMGADVVTSLATTANAFIVNLPEESVDQVAAMPGVKRVIPVRMGKLHMDAAPAILQAEKAWLNHGGADKAGLGIKIGIIDSGIDQTQPAFQDDSLVPPPGYPRGTHLDFTNKKVIVARSYVSLYSRTAPDQTPSDLAGHGTSVAMAAAGVAHDAPQGRVSGMAPKAFLGNYRASGPGASDSFSTDVIYAAFEDAVNDGMDVINLSLGSSIAERPEDDIFTDMVNAAAARGVVVVASAGNEGPAPMTMGDLAQAPLTIAVGATIHGRIRAATVAIANGASLPALPGTNTRESNADITARVVDVATLDPTGLACGALPAGSLNGAIALIQRNDCNFETKINSAAAAGATAVLIYTAADRPDAFEFGAGAATLPALMLNHTDGLHLKALAGAGAVSVTLRFKLVAAITNHRRLDGFSSLGPGTSFLIKPDVSAIGGDVYTAQAGGGYRTVSGTSFSSPIVAGAVAFLKSARPGLTVEHYRSLIINTAQWMEERLQARGNGSLHVDAAVNSTIAAAPASVSFGISGVNADASRPLRLTNLGTAAQTFSITVFPLTAGPIPTVSNSSVTLAPGQSSTVNALFRASGLPGGERNGLFIVQSQASGEQIFVPYWHGVPTNAPASTVVLYKDDAVRPSGTGFIYVRLMDAAGLPAIGPAPEVTVAGASASAGASVIRVRDFNVISPGLWEVQVRQRSTNGLSTFTIHAPGATDVSVGITAAP